MPRPYVSREINNPKDTRDMQVLLQKKPKMFFNFPKDWQEWFIKHPEMLSS
jgi:hypothetical protein